MTLEEMETLHAQMIKDIGNNEDAQRSSCHDALIAKFNIFARYMKGQGYSTEWRDILGDENVNPYTRKRIGDFACYLVFVNAINER